MATIRLSDIRGGVFRPGGVKLDGPTNITKGTTTTYRISNYDAFSQYTASIDLGTVSVTADSVNIVMPGATVGTQANLTVGQNGLVRTVAIPLEDQRVVLIPRITSPANNSTGLGTSITFQGSAFTSSPAGTLTHTSTDWQISRNSAFTQLIVTQTVSSGDLTKFTATVPLGETLYARLRYTSNSTVSGWSSAITLSTLPEITAPTVTGPATEATATPTFTSSAFTVKPVGGDTHASTSWIVKDTGANTTIYSLLNSATAKTEMTIPDGLLRPASNYSVTAQYNGALTTSAISSPFVFVTKNDFFPTTPGTPYEGGYYAGRIKIGTQVYALIVSPRAEGTFNDRPGIGINRPNFVLTMNDGWTNTVRLYEVTGASYTCIYRTARLLRIGGYSDWYIPSIAELDVCYRNLKPTANSNAVSSTSGFTGGALGYNPYAVPEGAAYTSSNPRMTTNPLFAEGGSEAFLIGTGLFENMHYTSSQNTTVDAEGVKTVEPYTKRMDTGAEGRRPIDDSRPYARAIRRVPVPG
jgi:hypothetical protein